MNKKKRFELKKYIGIIFSLLLGIISGIIFGQLLFEYTTEKTWYEELLYPIFLIIVIIISYITQIIIHETGHLIFGLLSGYRFSSFRIFSLMILKEKDKLKLKKLSIAGTAGQCLMLPPEMKSGRFPVVLYNLGGSLMNMIASAILFCVYILVRDIPYLSDSLLILAVFGVLSSLQNGIPMCMGTVNNDGYNAISLRNNPDAMKSFWIQLKVVELTTKGIRIKDMPDEWFALPSDEAMKNSMVATQGVLVCNRLMDAQKFDEADAVMNHILNIESGVVGLHRNLLICDRIYIELIKDNRKETIENMYSDEIKKFINSMKNYPSVIRTEYALALLFEKNTNKAKGIMERFSKRSKTYPYPNEIEAEKDLILLAESIFDNYEKASETI